MSATDFGDPDQIIHIPARDLTGTREAKLAELNALLSHLWSWVTSRPRNARGSFAHTTADTKSERF